MVIDMQKVILTGDRPTGRLHLGHYVGSIQNRVILQNSDEFQKIFIMIADAQALTDNANNPDKVRDNIIQVALDYLACGLDPNKSTIFIQSQIPELTELTFYYLNLVTLSRLQRNPTVKSEIKQRSFEKSIPVGFLTYPISQAADITAFKATHVPVGDDQLPMIEQTREIVRTFNNIYQKTLVEPEAILPQNKISNRLPGIDGKLKMSKTLNNCIYLSDSPEEIEAKVMKMFTDPNHLKVEDPGNTTNNPVFIYLEVFAFDDHFKKYLPEYNNLTELKAHYEKGGLGDVKIKKFLNNILQELLKPIREKRQELEKDPANIINILYEGTLKAQKEAQITLNSVKNAMRINYFKDKNFLNNYNSNIISKDK